MCGIFGCISEDASAIVLEGLRKLEYRGYDSAGLAAIFPQHRGPIQTERTTGFVSDLVSKANGRFKGSEISIGHTRWATHGGVTDSNAHPHSSNDGEITIVHNGIIENAPDLLERVTNLGYSVTSETDSEVIVHLLDHEIKTQPSSSTPLDAFSRTIQFLEGSWAIAAIIKGMDGILVARNGAPLIVGRGHGCVCVSSDSQPFFGRCSEVAYLSDGDFFLLTKEGIQGDDSSLVPSFEVLEGTYEEQDPGPFGHMMLKEIFDQPISLSNAMSGRISADGMNVELGGLALSNQEINALDRINIVACGSAYYASLIGVEFLRSFTNITVEAFRASEFPAKSTCNERTLTIGVSQSGETKDTLDALQEAKVCGSKISSFCNVIGSTMSRLTGNGAYLHAGPEFAVASTKAVSNMMALFALLSLSLSESSIEKSEIITEMRRLPNRITRQLLEDDGSIQKAVDLIVGSNTAIFIGRGISAPLTQEGALKMMEVAYLPCIAYPGGELKHGPIALIEEGTPVIAIAPTDSSLSLMESSIRECKSRGGRIILITDSDGHITETADVVIPSQSTHPMLSPIINAIPLQLLAYNLGLATGNNVDRPRNLAKSVTVV
ncbi:MAG: glutamine--fructose-6-phosphate transaminase (isomerizing) [Candidatus Thalassarchaeaceae archaeon]